MQRICSQKSVIIALPDTSQDPGNSLSTNEKTSEKRGETNQIQMNSVIK
jgi:hypothetical protein